jgi:hypothetical protein
MQVNIGERLNVILRQRLLADSNNPNRKQQLKTFKGPS